MGGECATYYLNSLRYVDRIKESRKKHAVQIIMEDQSVVQFALESGLYHAVNIMYWS